MQDRDMGIFVSAVDEKPHNINVTQETSVDLKGKGNRDTSGENRESTFGGEGGFADRETRLGTRFGTTNVGAAARQTRKDGT